jgi:hypothetical protein
LTRLGAGKPLSEIKEPIIKEASSHPFNSKPSALSRLGSVKSFSSENEQDESNIVLNNPSNSFKPSALSRIGSVKSSTIQQDLKKSAYNPSKDPPIGSKLSALSRLGPVSTALSSKINDNDTIRDDRIPEVDYDDADADREAGSEGYDELEDDADYDAEEEAIQVCR